MRKLALENFLSKKAFLALELPENLQTKIEERRNLKSFRMAFDSSGTLVLRKPKFVTKERVWSFVLENKDWILKRFLEFQQARGDLRRNQIFIFGEWRDFNDFAKYLDHKMLARVLQCDRNVEIFNCVQCLQELWNRALIEDCAQQESYKKILVDFYQIVLEAYVAVNLEIFAQKMQLFPEVVCYGKSYRQLGCCYAKTKKIRLSLCLALMPHYCIDSVMIHELAHLAHQNHSKEFWNLVGRFDANPKRIHQWLKTHHTHNLHLYHRIFKT